MAPEVRYFCHMCKGEVGLHDIAHRDLYVDLCWILCETCAELHGNVCGLDRAMNPHPHGYLDCPFRLVTNPRGNVAVVHMSTEGLPVGEPNGGERP